MPYDGDDPTNGGASARPTSLQLLLDSFVAITSEREVAAILERAVDVARLSTRAIYGAAVALENGAISAFVHAGLTRAQFQGMPHFPVGRGMLGAVLEDRAPIRIDVLQTDPRSVGFPLGHVPMEAFIGVPILYEGRLIGALYLTKRPGQGAFTEQDEYFMVALANQTAVALETARLFARLDEKTAVVQLLQNVAVAANEAASPDEALVVALDRICEYTGWPVGHVYTVEDEGRLVPADVWHLDDDAGYSTFRAVTMETLLARGEGLPGRVLESAQPVWIKDVRNDDNFPRAKAAIDVGIGAGFGFPVLVGSRVVAVLEFFSPEAAEPNEALLDVLANIGTQLGRVIERKSVETKLLALDRAKSEFIANAAHELRTPLTSIVGFAEILTSRRGDLDNESTDKMLDALTRQANRVRSLISNLLDLSQIDQGHLPVSLQIVPLAGALKRAMETTPPPANVTVTLDLEGDVAVTADLIRFDQVITNLLSNAYRYGGSSIVVSAHRILDRCTITVADDGEGVPEDLVAHLFEPFARGANAAKAQGSGLGLAICRRLVDAFGGTIGYSRGEPSGAVFTLDLPIAV
jgi:signal transduction histidine kinase